MDEFASAALVTAAARALAERGVTAPPPAGDGALLPLAEKRRWLAAVAHGHGLAALVRAGRSLATLPHPGIAALTAARTPAELFERWSRMERFTHSRHRVVVRESGAGLLVAEHTGPPGSPPRPEEDALIEGLLSGLLAAVGVREPACTRDGAATWRFTWSATDPEKPVRPPAVCGAGTPALVRRILAADLPRRWTLAGVASGLGLSPRSLQRRLAPDGGFAALVAGARAEAAADLLMNSRHPLPVVGFVCGYTDQPHFTREFRRRVAMTPATYRASFAVDPEVST